MVGCPAKPTSEGCMWRCGDLGRLRTLGGTTPAAISDDGRRGRDPPTRSPRREAFSPWAAIGACAKKTRCAPTGLPSASSPAQEPRVSNDGAPAGPKWAARAAAKRRETNSRTGCPVLKRAPSPHRLFSRHHEGTDQSRTRIPRAREEVVRTKRNAESYIPPDRAGTASINSASARFRAWPPARDPLYLPSRTTTRPWLGIMRVVCPPAPAK